MERAHSSVRASFAVKEGQRSAASAHSRRGAAVRAGLRNTYQLPKFEDSLSKVGSPKQKLTKTIRKPKATWVEPKFFADVEYRDITSEGLLRASSFKGLSKGTRRS
ncbi:hypothetical protein [Bradyrhizobium yuanmingense]|uniref:ATP dependent DNA ligase n=1 Tax=Bradyrhizobium yuanmingense TaxID=108015 RepID=UPI0031BA2E74